MHDGLIAPRNGNLTATAVARLAAPRRTSVRWHCVPTARVRRTQASCLGVPRASGSGPSSLGNGGGGNLIPLLALLGGALVFPGLSGKTLVSLTSDQPTH